MGLFLHYLIEFVCGEYFIVIKMLIQTSERMMWSIKRIFKSVYSNFHIMKSLTIYSIQKAATAGGALCGGDGAIHVLPCYTAFYRQPAAEHDRGLSKNYYCYRHMIRLP